MADWNVLSNLEFLCCFAQALVFFYARNINECAIFYSLSTSGFKTEASFNEKISFMGSGEKVFKSLNNSIVRRCEFLWCNVLSQPAIACSKLTIETLEQDVKYVQS